MRMVNFTNQFDERVYFDSSGEPVPLYDIINWQRDRANVMRCAASLQPAWKSLAVFLFFYFGRCILHTGLSRWEATTARALLVNTC